MRYLVVMIVGSCLASISAAADFNPFAGPKPIAVWIQADPWLDVIGSDTPRIAIYENGEVIYWKKVDSQFECRHVHLEKDALTSIRQRLRPIFAAKGLKPQYSLFDFTDAPEAMLYVRDGTREIATRVYGLSAPGTERLADAETPKGQQRIVLPDELLALHKWLYDFDSPQSEVLEPKYVDVMFWDYSYAPDASIQWPRDWPAFDSDRVVKYDSGPHAVDYSIFLDGNLLPKLREFLAARKERGAVELGGKKWAISYRYVFPSEPTWRKAFKAAAIKSANDSK